MNAVQNAVTIPLSRFAVIFFFYGSYCVLFGTSVYVLLKRKRPDLILHLGPIALLFVLATLGMLCNVVALGRDMARSLPTLAQGQINSDSVSARLILAHQFFYISSKAFSILNDYSGTVGELVLLYRVYVIWKSKLVTVIPSIFIMADLGVGLAGTFIPRGTSESKTNIILFRIVFMVLNLVTNVMLTMLIAGKICQIGRNAFKVLGPDVSKRYKKIVSIIFESGVMYPLSLLLFLILEARAMSAEGISAGTTNPPSRIVYEMLPFVVAIAPTLVLVRSWLGLCVVDLEQTIQMFRTDGRRELSEWKVADLPSQSTTDSSDLSHGRDLFLERGKHSTDTVYRLSETSFIDKRTSRSADQKMPLTTAKSKLLMELILDKGPSLNYWVRSDSPAALVYGYAQNDDTTIAYEAYIDAHSGEVLQRLSHAMHDSIVLTLNTIESLLEGQVGTNGSLIFDFTQGPAKDPTNPEQYGAIEKLVPVPELTHGITDRMASGGRRNLGLRTSDK
ncbi:hypothetical protein WG66_013671 [Moniliophthora roreri]|nr:hypothetical protein WG66_013671 [Moniliophthora roreri]